MGVKAREYRSPVHKLVRFFEKSRNQWKEKSVALRHQLKLAKNQVRAVEQSRAQWREKAEQAIAAAQAANAELEELRAANKSSSPESVGCRKVFPIRSDCVFGGIAGQMNASKHYGSASPDMHGFVECVQQALI